MAAKVSEGRLTWNEDGDRGLHGSADDVIHRKHPVRFDVMVPQDFVYLRTTSKQTAVSGCSDRESI